MPDYLQHKFDTKDFDKSEIERFSSEDEFCSYGVELLKEFFSISISISSIERRDSKNELVPYNKEEAALIGNLVRFNKLGSAFLEQITKKRLETSMIFFRCLAETYINLKYFLKFKDQHTLRHYIKHSLRQEMQLIEKIKSNIAGKDEVLHIEQRMMDSINRAFETSDFDFEEINNSTKWESKVKKRVFEIIDPMFYSFIYGNASHSVHGNWQDLISMHLKKVDNGFIPKSEWTSPRLQVINSLTILACDLLENYSVEVLPDSDEKNELLEAIKSLGNRCLILDKQHELFVQSS
ncbi:hypothetical protein ES705_39321 [subsurface metagenome]